MNRRNFLRSVVGAGAAAVAVRTFPFRVYSIPAAPQIALANQFFDGDTWILHPDQAQAFDKLLDMPLALRGQSRSLLSMGCIDGSTLGGGAVTYWRRADTYAQLDRALADGYQLPAGWKYDRAKRVITPTEFALKNINMRADVQVNRYLRGEWKT